MRRIGTIPREDEAVGMGRLTAIGVGSAGVEVSTRVVLALREKRHQQTAEMLAISVTIAVTSHVVRISNASRLVMGGW